MDGGIIDHNAALKALTSRILAAPRQEAVEPPPKPAKTTNPNGVVKRRNRIPLSCESCRARKLKCDRQKPCQNCKARDQGENCIYAADEGRGNRGGQLLNLSSNMGDRVQKLEALVNSMLASQQGQPSMSVPNAGTSSAQPTAMQSSTPTSVDELGGVDPVLQQNEPYAAIVGAEEGQQFLGPSHWEAVLRDISAIRESIQESTFKLRAPITVDIDKPAMLRTLPPIDSKVELIRTLPTKHLADRLLQRFWDYQDPSMPPIIHQPSFKTHFEIAYADLGSITYPRLAMLFTMFSMALQSYEKYGPEPVELRGLIPDLSNSYRAAAAQCLMTADLAFPGSDSVIAFQFYWLCEFYRCPKAFPALWMLQGMVIRKALLMGFHREPSNFPGISVFDAEIRRRSWHAMCQSDLLLSFHLGMPPAVDYTQTDVRSPISLYEDSLYETMQELPAERPKNEKTPIAYYISKRGLFQTFGAIIRTINSMYPPTDEEVSALNTQLADAYDAVHPHLRNELADENNRERLQRLNLANIFHKSICVLNRRSLFTNNRTSIQEQSRDSCIKSALEILRIQESMHESHDKWWDYIYTRHDFLLASVLVCMILYTFKKYAKPDSNMFDLPSEAEESIYRNALERAREIWATVSEFVPEAQKACSIIDATVYQANETKASIGADSVESAVYSALSTGTLPTPEFVPIYSSIDFDKIDWDSWDKMIQASVEEVAEQQMPDPLLHGNYFGSPGAAQL